jgi:type I site-specific restriction endonuclease
VVEDLSEYQTRKSKIDTLLQQGGWNVNNATQVLSDIDINELFNSLMHKAFTGELT